MAFEGGGVMELLSWEDCNTGDGVKKFDFFCIIVK